jgi:hypothetical protein
MEKSKEMVGGIPACWKKKAAYPINVAPQAAEACQNFLKAIRSRRRRTLNKPTDHDDLCAAPVDAFEAVPVLGASGHDSLHLFLDFVCVTHHYIIVSTDQE